LKSITFRVRVPVLSEKMYLIWPRSEFMLEVRAVAGMSSSSSYIFRSLSIKKAWQ